MNSSASELEMVRSLGCIDQLASLQSGKTKRKERKKWTLVPKDNIQNNTMAFLCMNTCSYTFVHTERGTHTEAHMHTHRGTHIQKYTHRSTCT